MAVRFGRLTGAPESPFLALNLAIAAVIGEILLDAHFGDGMAAGIALVTLELRAIARAKDEEMRGAR